MGRAPCCEKVGLKRGRWTAEEDDTLVKYIQANGEGNWKSLPKNAGLLRCGKSCRLRWINYLRGDLKRGNMTLEEDEMIVKLHKAFGNRWSVIASHLPGRTDNEIKNYWNSRLSRQIYRFFTGKSGETIDLSTLVNPKKQRVGRVSRNVAKKYNNDRSFKHDKSPTPTLLANKLSSPPIAMDKQVDPNKGDCSTRVTKSMEESPAYDDNGVNDELGSLELLSQVDELIDIEYFLESDQSMDPSGILSIRDEDQIQQMMTETDVGDLQNSEKNNIEEIEDDLSFNSWKTMCSGFDETEWDMEFGFTGFNTCDEGDDMLVWLWEGGNP